MNKLSIELLADAVTNEICSYGCGEGNPFVIIAHAATLKILRKFIKAMKIHDSSYSCLWGMPFVCSEKIPRNSILIGSHSIGRETQPEDFAKALRNGLDNAPKPTGKFMKTMGSDRSFEDSGVDVWGRLISI